MHKSNILPLSLILLSFFSFSLSNLFTRITSFYDLLPISFYFILSKLLSVIIFLFFGYLSWGTKFFFIKNKIAVSIRCIILSINTISLTFALTLLPFDIFYSIVFIMPILITLLGILILNEDFSIKKIFLIITGFIGVSIVINPNFNSQLAILGITLTLVTALTGAISAIIARKYLINENPFSATFYPILTSFLLGVPITIYLEKPNLHQLITSLSPPSLLLILGSAISYIIASSLFLKAYQSAKANLLAPMQYSQIIWGVLFGYFFFNDSLSLYTSIGCIIIVLSGFFNSYSFNLHK